MMFALTAAADAADALSEGDAVAAVDLRGPIIEEPGLTVATATVRRSTAHLQGEVVQSDGESPVIVDQGPRPGRVGGGAAEPVGETLALVRDVVVVHIV